MNQPDKRDIVITVSLKPYYAEAENIVREKVCAMCENKTCGPGKPCLTFFTFRKVYAWTLKAENSKNN